MDELHRYAETVVTVECAGQSFTAKGKTVLALGWKRYAQEQAETAPALPVVTENQTLSVYRENRELLRFHFHRPQALLTCMEDLSLPRKEYHSDMAAVPKTGRFITEDEIAASLANGSSFEGGKTRIHEFFQTPHTTKESADFLKKEYGIGGRTHAVSRESGSYEDHGSKGIVLKKNGCADIQMNWNKVASRISELVRLNRYLTPDEQAAYDKEMAQDAIRRCATWQGFPPPMRRNPRICSQSVATWMS